ncbi:hypothetical protein P153DRAFT_373503 [Dothidotthia symphoricarpi CBS 119687]|uniref:Rhodopsin domain-containing protein n=1 Tax=Dothidotthia symphoricarpi CBS 119687 TaxID=1392245 RepID=A0A6A6ALZ0_9PLEO|nr:uncharacterized protein P153DRAFT_373503 [Dothidotthia symphoricarpi CBS 119687]KAF2132810.1 hypothetical protein P153DRAFT_373503 [Dothidotthia symphoricarpi CBS 119687]
MPGETFGTSFQHGLAFETWILYGISIFLILLRTVARWRRVRSPSQFAADDWVMITAVPLFYTGLVVCLNATASGGGSNLYPPEQLPGFTQEEINDRIEGSKIVVVSEQCMLNLIWTLKACMLLMLARMTTGTIHLKLIRIVAVYTIVGWVAVQITFFAACQPFKGYWAMPPPNSQCTTLEHYAYVQASFNITSDLLIIAVPLPMVMALKLPIKQKIGLGLLFSMGTFVIIAAILTKYYNLSDIYSTVYMFWYTREASVAIWVSNLPGIWPLMREHIRFLRERTGSYVNSSNRLPQYAFGSSYGNTSKGRRSHIRTGNFQNIPSATDIEMGATVTRPGVRSLHFSEKPGSHISEASSRVSVDSDERALNQASYWKNMHVLEVQVDTKVEIQRDNWDGEKMEITTHVEGPEGEARQSR